MISYYNDYELEFFIEIIDNTIKDYNEKIEILDKLRTDFFNDLKSRGDY